MALDYSILNLKKTTVNSNGEQQLDLLTKVVNNVKAAPRDVIVVNKWYVARPDLLSLALYGDDRYADILCKYNGISNPFEINEDDILFVPDLSMFGKMIEDRIVPSEFVNENSTLQINDKPWQVDKNAKRSPSEQVIGEETFIIDRSLGIVYF